MILFGCSFEMTGPRVPGSHMPTIIRLSLVPVDIRIFTYTIFKRPQRGVFEIFELALTITPFGFQEGELRGMRSLASMTKF
jgi:hypothetical protein